MLPSSSRRRAAASMCASSRFVLPFCLGTFTSTVSYQRSPVAGSNSPATSQTWHCHGMKYAELMSRCQAATSSPNVSGRSGLLSVPTRGRGKLSNEPLERVVAFMQGARCQRGARVAQLAHGVDHAVAVLILERCVELGGDAFVGVLDRRHAGSDRAELAELFQVGVRVTFGGALRT